jgi:hypothetical protein
VALGPSLRQQYHLRRRGSGFDAWDVNRLIALSRDLRPETVRIEDLPDVDEPYWFQGDDVPTCRAIAKHMMLTQAVDLSFPILLCAQGRVMDGMHRIVKALLEGRSHIEAKRFETTPAPDFTGVQPDDLPYDTVGG